MIQTKKELRKTCLEKISKITDQSKRSFLMKEELLFILKDYKSVALFASLDHEIDTIPLIEELLKQDKNIYLPRTEGEVINFYQIHSLDELEISSDKYKVREPKRGAVINPSSIDVIICPGIAFDRNNNRLGHGKGYYDKYLVNCPAYKIGICYKEQLFDEIPTSIIDIKMDKVLSY